MKRSRRFTSALRDCGCSVKIKRVLVWQAVEQLPVIYFSTHHLPVYLLMKMFAKLQEANQVDKINKITCPPPSDAKVKLLDIA